MIIDEEDYLAHYGILRKSGRYPWGSGETQSIRNKTFLDITAELKREGLTGAEIARGFGITRLELDAARTIARNQQQQENINQAQRLKDKGYSNVAIGQRMGINESSVRSLLAPGQKEKLDILTSTAEMLKKQVAEKEYIQIGKGTETGIPLGGTTIGISKEKLAAAVALLKEEGYTVHYIKIPQLGTNQQTTLKVLAKPDIPYAEVYRNRDKIQIITDYTDDGGRSYTGLRAPTSISSKRVGVKYAEEGGAAADGVIYVRPGVENLSLGKSQYAQVRIAVDGTHYLKGMAIYKDDLPDGVDLVFNTNKSDTGNKKDAFKKFGDDPINPFTASISRQHGHMNIVNEEGDWDNWSRNLSSQVLSKQTPALAQQQLARTQKRRREELDDIMALTNPTVRKKLLETYADETDSASVHLKAAALPRQATRVILPVNSVRDTEIYAPSFRDGERVALVRFPHAGKFEIPELTVNNKNVEARRLLGANAKDAVGINSRVAERLSGADFDGDTVLVIPNNDRSVKSEPALEGLKGFDPKTSFPPYDGMRTIDGGVYNAKTNKVDFPKGAYNRKQREMGNVTNLIADMSIRGASKSEMARAVRHSMVVIDSEKHVLDYKASAKANGISQLKQKYQDGANAGASTLITKATSETRVKDRRARRASEGGAVDPVTGRKMYVPTGKQYVDKKGKTQDVTIKSQKLAEATDATKLSSGTRIENVYADHSNQLKGLANAARKEALSIKAPPVNKSAKQTYANEVESLKAKLNLANKNAPLEKQAQIIGNAQVRLKQQANPNMDAAELKKIKGQALVEARIRTGAAKQRIEITQAEWNAIQAGAISDHQLSQILANSNLDRVRELATPRPKIMMTSSVKARAQMLLDRGYTQAEVADDLGVSLSTLKAGLDGGE